MGRAMVVTLALLMAGELPATAGLAGRIEEASSAARTWVGWSVPSTVAGGMCCGDWRSERIPRHCSLDDEDASWYREGANETQPIALGMARVWVRAEAGKTDRIRVVSLDCELDTSNARVVLLEPVDPAESVDWLDGRLQSGPEALSDEVLSAIAVHADPAADAVLERLLVRGSDSMRPKAAFWLAAARGSRGAQAVIDRFSGERDARERRELVFPLYIAGRSAADEILVRAARHDPSAEVRKQALFWIAQRAGERATATLEQALEDDPQGEVRQHAVFAISQLPPDRSVPILIRLAGEHDDPEVRRQAIFWLGQIDDPLALDFLVSMID